MKKIILFTFFLIAFFALNSREIFACDCAMSSDRSPELIEKDYRNSKGVFSGRVIQIDKNPRGSLIRVKFKVEKSWKNISQNEIIIITSEGTDECGFPFKEGERYLVYASDGFFDNLDNLEAVLCSGTSLLKSNKDVSVLNKIKKPKKF